MEDKIKKLKEQIAEYENDLKDPDINENEIVVESLKSEIEKFKKELAELESQVEKKVEVAETKVEEAEKKVEEAETKEEKKEAQAEVKDAKEEVKEAQADAKEVEKLAEKVEKVEEKTEKVEVKQRGGVKAGAGRPKIERMKRMEKKAKASKPTKIKKPKGVEVKPLVSKRYAKKVKAVKKDRKPTRLEKEKSVRAFGQVVKYKNDAEFCKKLIQALKKRRVASKKDGKRRKTKPVFGVIVSSTKNAVHKALHSVSEREIQKNPKQFLAKAQRLEKSAIRFLEDFKSILGSDYKKSEITAEFGELEKSIKSFVDKIKNK